MGRPGGDEEAATRPSPRVVRLRPPRLRCAGFCRDGTRCSKSLGVDGGRFCHVHAKFGDELWGPGGSTTAGQEDAAHPTSPPAPVAAEEPPAEEPTRPKAARAFQRHVAGRASL